MTPSSSKATSLCRGTLDSSGSRVLFQFSDAWSDDALKETQELWELSPEALSQVRELGERLIDIHHVKNCPDQAIRFLIPNKFNVSLAEKQFRRMIHWRLAHNVDDIAKPDEALIRFFPGAILRGRDREGDPIFMNRNGAINAPLLFDTFGREGFLTYVIWIREHVARGAWKSEFEKTKTPKYITIIDDLQGLNWWQILRHPTILGAFAEGMRIDQDFYPETAKRILVVRVPPVFETIWRILSRFFDPHVREKMIFCGKSTYESTLSTYMDLKVLPREVTPFGVGTVDIDMPSSFAGVLDLEESRKGSLSVEAPRDRKGSANSEELC